MRLAPKSSIYRNEVIEAAVECLWEVMEKFHTPGFRPRPLDCSSPEVVGRERPSMIRRLSNRWKMLEPRSDPVTFKWRRTAFTRIDGAVDIVEDDWSLRSTVCQRRVFIACAAARTTGDGFGPCRFALVASRSTAGRGMRTAAARRERLARRSCGRWETPKRGNRRARGKLLAK
jgi:hypothetical protein